MPIKYQGEKFPILEQGVEATTSTSGKLFLKLRKACNDSTDDSIHKAVADTLKNVCGSPSLSGFYNNPTITDEQKIATFKQCLTYFTGTPPPEMLDPLAAIPTVNTDSSPNDPIETLGSVEMPMDVDFIKKVVHEVINGLGLNQQFASINKNFQALSTNDTNLDGKIIALTEQLKNFAPVSTITINKWDGSKVSIEEKHHRQLGELVQLISSRNHEGWPEHVWCHGAPGSGKTRLTRQIAACLSKATDTTIPFYVFPGGPTTTEGKMLGYNNVATGTFVQGWLYKGFKDGGVCAIDEGDLCDAAVMAASNSIENDEFMFGNGERVPRHRNFFLIVWANTTGQGSGGGFVGTNKQNAALLDRFTPYELTYDPILETAIWGSWATYVQKVRSYVEKNMNNSVYVTPRASRKGWALLKNGFTPARTVEIIFGRMQKQHLQTIIANVGAFSG